MSIKKLKNGKWQVSVRDIYGTWFPRKSFARKVDAENYQYEVKSKKKSGDLVLSKAIRTLTVSAYFEFWIKECRDQVNQGWIDSQRGVFKNHIKNSIGHLYFVDVDQRDIQRVLAKAKEKGLGGQSRSHIYSTLKKMFGDGIEHFEYIKFNPVLKKFKPKIVKKERNFLSESDLWFLLKKLQHSKIGPAAWICGLAGMRIGEVQYLRWKHIDFEGRRILIKGTFNKKIRKMQDHPKQKKHGSAPMPEPLAKYLSGLKGRDEDFVIKGVRSANLNYDTYRKAINKACVELGITRIQTHELRHSAAMLYRANGATQEQISKVLNHSSSKVTETYIHDCGDELRAVVDKIKMVQPKLSAV